jgi:hypothetical protein
MTEDWRYEADEEWLAAHRGRFFKRRRSKFLLALADANLGPYRGAPRKPALRLSDKEYSFIRIAPHEYTHTAIQVDLHHCQRCGRLMLEEHRLVYRIAGSGERTLGLMRGCRHCEKDGWLFRSGMPSAIAGRERDRTSVL